jgi:Zn-dependent protease with chaperone function
MGKGIGILVLSVFVAPALGLFASMKLLGDIASSGHMTEQQVIAYCVSAPDVDHAVCQTFSLLELLFKLSIGGLIATLALPLLYWISALLLARNRDRLTQFFPPLVRITLGLLPVLLVAHGLLIWFASWELLQAGLLPMNLKLLAVIFFIGGGLLLAALSIVADMRRLLTQEPLRVTGIAVEEREYPELFERVKRLATRLGSRAPERIVLGIEPNAYVAKVPILLRGIAELPTAETLYLPTLALRVLDDAELDALIGHELGHFRGADLEFSSRFAPAFASLEQAVRSVAVDDDDEEQGALKLARLPAIGMLSLMVYILHRVVNRVRREREFAADRAAIEVSRPAALISTLIKFGAITHEWPAFRHGVTRLLHQGLGRRNIASDYLARTRQFLDSLKPEQLHALLAEGHAPHPLDTHPTLAARAAAVGVTVDPLIATTILALRTVREPSAALLAIEEKITAADLDYSRVPGHPITISADAALPAELALRPASS